MLGIAHMCTVLREIYLTTKLCFILQTDGSRPTGTIVVKTISPSPSPVISTAAPTSNVTTRVIQIGGGNRFIRPTVVQSQVQPQPITVRPIRQAGQTQVVATSSANLTPQVTPTTQGHPISNPIIVRTSSPNNVATVPSAVWPSQPLTTIQLQDLFQRPRPPQPLTLSQGGTRTVQGTPIVRTILVPRTMASGSGQHTAQIVNVQPQQASQQVNTPLPNIQLPSEPVPFSLQVNFTPPFKGFLGYIQPWPLAYKRLLNKPYINEVFLRKQNLS